MKFSSTRSIALLACAGMLISGFLMISTKAIAVVLIPETTPGLLSLWTDSYPLQYHDLDPGEAAFIRLNVALDDTDRGDLTLEVRKDGDLATVPGGLRVTVERCAVGWTAVPSGVTDEGAPACAAGRSALLTAGSSNDFAADSPRWSLGEIQDERTVYLLVTLALPSSTPAASVDGLSARFGFGLFAQGRAVASPINSDELALTGVDVLALALVAVGAIGAGTILGRSRARAAKS